MLCELFRNPKNIFHSIDFFSRYVSRAIFVLATFGAFVFPNFAKSEPLPEPLSKMQLRYEKVSTLTAKFRQKQKSVALGTNRESSGDIAIKRPNKFRWQTLDPDPSLLVGNGKKIWYYTPPFKDGAKGQVMVKKAANVQSQLAVDLLSGGADLRKNFKITVPGTPGDNKQARYELKPLKPAGDVERIELFIETSTNLIYKLILFTSLGNETELTLEDVKLGTKLPDSMFNFKVPENTEEIR